MRLAPILIICLAATAWCDPAAIEDDWRRQDGIGTEREPSTCAAAIERTLARGDRLLAHLRRGGVRLDDLARDWEALRKEWTQRSADPATPDAVWEALWRRVHGLRRRIVFRNPLAQTGPLVFAKRVPSAFSHQLTQYCGRDAQPGGGIFVLEEPGRSFRCRQLAAGLPTGSPLHPDVAWDGQRIVFAYAPVDEPPRNRSAHPNVFYHLYDVRPDGSGLRQLTDGPQDDFAPRILPNGHILFLSTRRGGFHRCGRGPCPTYTLATCEPDGAHPHTLSWHETHEWDPCVLHDGRIVYTRWDYVDRHAVHYQQLWACRPDGTLAAAFYGNNTLSPVGTWEARPVPGSRRIMATAAAHHAMTAGSIILLDVARGIDGPLPITRLTPDALFPESEVPVRREPRGHWHAPVGVPRRPAVPVEQKRWPGHCYRSPYPLSETFFLAAYSYEPLIGEPTANRPHMFGLYLCDAFGNKELLYRDPAISSIWPIPLRPRPMAHAVPSVVDEKAQPQPASGPGVGEGTFLLLNVYESFPALPPGSVKSLRIVQVLPKSTPHINSPRVGLPNASPGRQVLGTVPVEADGSAHFRAPARLPIAFQALDERGMAVQVMRSLVYLQPGETAACIGCHEPRSMAPPAQPTARALFRPPSAIEPGPDGSKPLSYPLLVQPVLDRHCTRCHSGEKPKKGIVLTGAPQGQFTCSYNALAPCVTWSAWGGRGGDFRKVNSEPLSRPGFFGALGSPVMAMLLKGHNDVKLTADDLARLATWMDSNALFYGTFDTAAQARQRAGERIPGPAVE